MLFRNEEALVVQAEVNFYLACLQEHTDERPRPLSTSALVVQRPSTPPSQNRWFVRDHILIKFRPIKREVIFAR